MANPRARICSLAAVCIQSTALAIVLHVSQANLKPGQVQYKASSAVLITELGKLALSLLLALRDVYRERAALLAPRHNLPSPDLYNHPDDFYSKDLCAPEDPFSQPEIRIDSVSPEPGAFPNNGAFPNFNNNLRRRSSTFMPKHDTLTVTMADGGSKFPMSSLHAFQFPRAPLSPIFSEKGTPMIDGSASPDIVNMLSDPVLWTRRRRLGLRAMLWEDIFGSDWWKMAIPAVLFAVQNNLIYVAARNLSVPVFQITFQLKTLITAITAVVMLNRRLSPIQWVSLVVLGGGVAAMQIGAIHAKARDSHNHGPVFQPETMGYFTGVASVLVSCIASAIAATYFELVIKKPQVVPDVPEFLMVAPPEIKPASLWVRNIQLSLFSTVFGAIVVIAQANPAHFTGFSGLSLDFKGILDPLEHWYDPVFSAAHGFFDGFHASVWAVIGLQTVGGLLIALAIKHADNVAKGFALSISIVFTFLLSVIMFNFELSASSVLGGLGVVGSTLLFEADERTINRLMGGPEKYGSNRPLFRRWHYILLVVLATTFSVALIPSRHLSVTSAAWDLVHQHDQHLTTPDQPTIAVADMGPINDLLTRAAGAGEGQCAWGIAPQRATTQGAFGGRHPVASDYPYHVTNTNQYALDDVLTTRLQDYARNVPLLSSPSPDFIFLPLLSQIYSNPWSCEAPDLIEGIRQTTAYIRQLAASVGKTAYPRIIIPVATIRSNLEKVIFTPELMEELKDSIVVVSIESAPKTYTEGLKYTIDVPYPTAFHLSPSGMGSKPGVDDYWLNQERPYLLHYAAAATHPWGLPPSDPFNGFALRAALHKQFSTFVNSPPVGSKTQIQFDDITNAYDGAQNLTAFHEHMASSVFCPMPAGDSPTRRAIYEALLLGCIPVIFRERSYGRLFPSSPEVNDASKWSVYVDENEISNGVGPSLIERLELIEPHEIRRMQRHIRSIAAKLQWSLPEAQEWFPPAPHSQRSPAIPDGAPVHNRTLSLTRQRGGAQITDAFVMLLRELESIKSGEWVAGVARDHRKGMTPQRFGKPIAR